MSQLLIHNQEIESVFDLIGDLENDITKSIAWTLVKCPLLLEKCIDRLLNTKVDKNNTIIKYQVSESDKGITDLEITDGKNYCIIVEAKRGWILPDYNQLKKYSERESFLKNPAKHKAIVSMSECSPEYAFFNLPQIAGVNIKHLSWKELLEMTDIAITESGRVQKNVLNELKGYIERIMTTQNNNSNMVYVVSLANTQAKVTTEDGQELGGNITYLDIVLKHNLYCCPIFVQGWPREPLTYIAFRYNKTLQSIHHIENYVITNNLHPYIPELPDVTLSQTHIIYTLGPAIIPTNKIRAGKKVRYGRKVWARIDTLFTANTLSEAEEISRWTN